MQIQTGHWDSKATGVEEFADLVGMERKDIEKIFPNASTKDRKRLAEGMCVGESN